MHNLYNWLRAKCKKCGKEIGPSRHCSMCGAVQ